jgi:hypothetical protein
VTVAKDIVQDLWDRAQEEEPMTTAQIQSLLEPQIRKNAFSVRLWIWFYLAVGLVTLILNGINIFGYWGNPGMRMVQVSTSIIMLGFLGYGVFLLTDLARIDGSDENVLSTLRRRLRFYQTKVEIWMWIVALTVYLLGFAINTMVDNQNGEYRIHQPALFVGISVGMILFMYAAMKIAQYPLVRELMAIVSDLENQVTEGTDQLAILKKNWRWWSVLLSIVLTLFLIWGLILAIQ